MVAFFTQKKKKSGLENALKSIKQNPNNPNNYLLLGQLYLEEGNKEKGIDSMFKAADLFSKEAFITKAIAIYKKIEEIDPKNL